VEFSLEAGAAAPMRQIADFADAAPQPRKKAKRPMADANQLSLFENIA